MLDASGVPGPRLLRHVQYVRPVDRPGACFGVSVIETIDLRASVIRTIQRYVNFHSSVTVDLFGSDLSSNAATFYTTGLKGRFREQLIQDDHVLKEATYSVLEVVNGALACRQAPALNALNERLRDDFMQDSIAGVSGWNTLLEKRGVDFRFALPHKAFNRQIGPLAARKFSPSGELLTGEQWTRGIRSWLPTEADREFVRSLMGRVVEPGKFANWIAPPSSGINGQPLECQYVRFN